MKKLDQETFICLDCEMTGLDFQKDQIIEVAVTRFSFDEVLEEFESLIDPQREIPPESIAIHHITNEMVQGKPLIAEVLPQVLKIIGNHVVIGHGIQNDIEMIARAAERYAIQTTLRRNRFIDTLRLARLYGESPVNSLEQLRRHFNVEPEGAHRAMSDVIVNMHVFRHLCREYKSIDEVFAALSRPILMKIMPLGKHKGRPLKEIPLDYLRWAANKDFDEDLLFSLRSEIKKRKRGNLFSQETNPFRNLTL
jgi:DNA polymerase-3 subunit epsilon